MTRHLKSKKLYTQLVWLMIVGQNHHILVVERRSLPCTTDSDLAFQWVFKCNPKSFMRCATGPTVAATSKALSKPSWMVF